MNASTHFAEVFSALTGAGLSPEDALDKFQHYAENLATKADIQDLKKENLATKEDIQKLEKSLTNFATKADIQVLKADIQVLKADIQVLKTGLAYMKWGMGFLGALNITILGSLLMLLMQ